MRRVSIYRDFTRGRVVSNESEIRELVGAERLVGQERDTERRIGYQEQLCIIILDTKFTKS